MNANPNKPRLDRVRRQAQRLLATTACNWNLAGQGLRAQAVQAGQALAGAEPLRIARAPRPSTVL